MIVWTEPFLPEIPHLRVRVYMEREDALEAQMLLGEMNDIEYETEQEALVDFMAVRNAIDTDNEINIGYIDEAPFIGH